MSIRGQVQRGFFLSAVVGVTILIAITVSALITVEDNVSTAMGQAQIALETQTTELMTQVVLELAESKALLNAEKERISAELSVATEIQASMLPFVFPAYPQRPEFDLHATMTPAKEVGGDFYDFFLIDEDHLALVIADVSGKGIPAALFMVISKTLLKNMDANRQIPQRSPGTHQQYPL